MAVEEIEKKIKYLKFKLIKLDATFTKNEWFTRHLVTGKDEETNTREDRTSTAALQPVIAVTITANFVKNVFYIFCLC